MMPELTETELELLDYLAKGCTNEDMANYRGVPKRTTELQTKALRVKLGAANSTEAVATWLKQKHAEELRVLQDRVEQLSKYCIV